MQTTTASHMAAKPCSYAHYYYYYTHVILDFILSIIGHLGNNSKKQPDRPRQYLSVYESMQKKEKECSPLMRAAEQQDNKNWLACFVNQTHSSLSNQGVITPWSNTHDECCHLAANIWHKYVRHLPQSNFGVFPWSP